MKKTVRWSLAQTMEYKWWQNYLRKKDPDDYLKWKLKYWQDLLQELSKFIVLPENKVVLDAGCGPAGIFMALDKNRVTAIDPLMDRYENLIHFDKNRYPFTTFEKKTIEAIDECEKYDTIFCINAINHVNDLSLSYDKLVAALKPSGYLIISTDAHRSNFLKKIFQFLPGDILHPHQYNIEEYRNFLTKRNMQIVQDILYKQEAIFNYYFTIAKKL